MVAAIFVSQSGECSASRGYHEPRLLGRAIRPESSKRVALMVGAQAARTRLIGDTEGLEAVPGFMDATKATLAGLVVVGVNAWRSRGSDEGRGCDGLEGWERLEEAT